MLFSYLLNETSHFKDYYNPLTKNDYLDVKYKNLNKVLNLFSLMKILLIHPHNYIHRYNKGLFPKYLRYAPTTMPTIKSLIPKDIQCEIKVMDEMAEEIDINYNPDLVCLTAITGTAKRAYELASIYRKKGATIIMGGVHATLMTNEALEYVDCVVKGYAEGCFEKVMRDYVSGKLKRIYECKNISPNKIKNPDKDCLKKSRYFQSNTIELTKGCINECEFCVNQCIHPNYLKRDIKEVINEIKKMKGKVVTFLDSNLVGDTEYAKKFFKELKKLNKWWTGCASLDMMHDEELLDLIASSGCKGLIIGFESISIESLIACNKKPNIGKDYIKVIERLHDKGIIINGTFVFGLDTDHPDVFKKTAEFIIKSKIDLPQYTIYTPFPGTKTFERLKKEERILNEDWDLYNGQNVVFKPKNMTAEELLKGTNWVRRKTFSTLSILKRLNAKPYSSKPYSLISNICFKHFLNKIEPLNRVA